VDETRAGGAGTITAVEDSGYVVIDAGEERGLKEGMWIYTTREVRCGVWGSWEISLNPRSLLGRSQLEVAGVFLHELLHLAEELGASGRTPPRSRNNYHSGWIRRTCSKLGIPCTKFGASEGILPGSQLTTWAEKHDVTGHPVLELPDDAPLPRPRRKRVTWVCGCDPDERVAVRVAVGHEFEATCKRSGEDFERE
jgi:hypothetical protein